MIGGGLTIAKSLFKFLPYDLEKGFHPTLHHGGYGCWSPPGESSLKSMQDILATPPGSGQADFGAINPGSVQHLSAELFRSLAHIDVTMVPYKTTPELLTGLLRGTATCVRIDPAAPRPGDRSIWRSPSPDRSGPRISRTADRRRGGPAGLRVTSWNGLAAPAGTRLRSSRCSAQAVNGSRRIARREGPPSPSAGGPRLTSADCRRGSRPTSQMGQGDTQAGIEKK